jgi:hypothetical protein
VQTKRRVSTARTAVTVYCLLLPAPWKKPWPLAETRSPIWGECVSLAWKADGVSTMKAVGEVCSVETGCLTPCATSRVGRSCCTSDIALDQRASGGKAAARLQGAGDRHGQFLGAVRFRRSAVGRTRNCYLAGLFHFTREPATTADVPASSASPLDTVARRRRLKP